MEYKVNVSLYAKLKKAIDENHGVLPSDFILNPENVSDDFVVTEGTMDTFLEKHLPAVEAGPYINILKSVSDGREDIAVSCCSSLFKPHSVRFIQIKDQIGTWLQENHDKMQDTNVKEFIKSRIVSTTSAEELKFMLYCSAAFDSYDDEMKEILLNLVKNGEVSHYCFNALKNFPEGNEIIFEIAKNSDDQDLADAVYALNADNEEKKIWLIMNGRPSFLGWYSTSAVIARKCDFSSMLKDPELSIELRDRIGHITSCFFEEGPAVGLRDLPNWKQICIDYIQLVRRVPSAEGIRTINYEERCLVEMRYEDGTFPAPIIQLLQECQDALDDPKILAFAADRLKEGKDLDLSDILDLPVDQDAVLNMITSSFWDYGNNIKYLKNWQYRREAFDVMLRHVDFCRKCDKESEEYAKMRAAASCYIPVLTDPSFFEDRTDAFMEQCRKMLMIGLDSRKGTIFYFTAEIVAEELQKQGICLGSELNEKLQEIQHQNEEQDWLTKVYNSMKESMQKAIEEKQKRKEGMS